MKLLNKIATGLNVPATLIREIAASATFRYKTFEIPKNRGGNRMIHAPSSELKAVQRWLAQNIVEILPQHPSAMAYRKNHSIKQNASLHKTNKYILRVDFKNFFGSITRRDVRIHLEQHVTRSTGWTWSNDDYELFGQLVTRRHRLTIGAPTSPGLSNSICFDLDWSCAAIASRIGATYSRYADDLVFSSNEKKVLLDAPREIERILETLRYPRLAINHKKTCHSSPKRRRMVTGLVITPTGDLSIGRHTKRHIRSMIHSINTLNDNQRTRLSGLLGFLSDVEPDYINNLIIKYGRDYIDSASRMTLPKPRTLKQITQISFIIFDESFQSVLITRNVDRGSWRLPTGAPGSKSPTKGDSYRLREIYINVLGPAGSRLDRYPNFILNSNYFACQLVDHNGPMPQYAQWLEIEDTEAIRNLTYTDRDIIRIHAKEAADQLKTDISALGR